MCKNYLSGYWESSNEFCEKSKLKSAQVYVALDNDVETIYFYIESPEEIKLNRCVPVEFNTSLWRNLGENNFEFDILVEDDINPLPQKMTGRVNIYTGVLVLFSNDIIQLELYKNNKATVGTV